MGHWWDARNTPEGWRFREYSSVVDRYLTPPLDEQETRHRMWWYYTELEKSSGIAEKHMSERIARAKERGTTLKDYPPQDINGPWENEICDKCSGLHNLENPCPPKENEEA